MAQRLQEKEAEPLLSNQRREEALAAEVPYPPFSGLGRWLQSRSETQQLIIGVVFVLTFGVIGMLLTRTFASDDL